VAVQALEGRPQPFRVCRWHTARSDQAENDFAVLAAEIVVEVENLPCCPFGSGRAWKHLETDGGLSSHLFDVCC
jgi:hypothetical protein